ncbi:MAG: 1-aminocyclopropane-1-carboxylate deaminase [Campylobacterota bacterium]|nr:1-aminocyclopropane-1-carboxylate deaminase [Campylobacterota bacterium]
MQNITNSPIEQITFNNQTFLVKRDDLLHRSFSGNKARKFYYFFKNDFLQITTLISHGSNQSNAMYSLSSLAKLKGWRFIYYTNHIPSFLEENPQGNYKYALENGMKLIVGEYEFNSIKSDDNNILYIDEGGAIEEASYGLEILANEITQYKTKNNINNMKVFLPSGTGTTALFLQKFLDIEVLTCPCVGDSVYLKKQFLELEKDESLHPTIIKPKKKYHFGKLYKENYEIWNRLKKETNIEFDLLYDPVGWNTLLNMYENKNSKILYIHQGGIIGNETMIQRYRYKYSL